DKRFADKIVAIPPGGGSDYLTAYVHPQMGKNYLRRFFSSELGVRFTRDYRLISDGVAQGKYTIAIYVGSGGRDIDRLGKRGLPVANFGQIIKEPVKERPTLQGTGSSNNIMVLDRRPNPNATKLFLNWFLSKEGQTIRHTKSSGTPDQSFRLDVTEMGKVHEAEMRRPGIDYMMVAHDRELQKKRPEAEKFVEQLYRKRQGGG
ncbi:MAG: hypothetical protein GTO40_01600, partial [Deltaproteobacteria bacterium]|nr:hypothetical protein [Deltaproteobacteria bacterium]